VPKKYEPREVESKITGVLIEYYRKVKNIKSSQVIRNRASLSQYESGKIRVPEVVLMDIAQKLGVIVQALKDDEFGKRLLRYKELIPNDEAGPRLSR